MTASQERRASIELTAKELRAVTNALGNTDANSPDYTFRPGNLSKLFWEKTREAEGILSPDNEYDLATDLMSTFKEGVGKVSGYPEAVAEAYLTTTPRKIRLTDAEGTEWNVEYYFATSEYNGTPAKFHREGLAMTRDDGIGFATEKTWWTGEPPTDLVRGTNGTVDFTSDTSKDAFGRIKGYHSGTVLGGEMAKKILEKLLTNTAPTSTQSA
jgi:hypothetical protein